MLIEVTEYHDGYAGDGARGRGRDRDDASRGEASFRPLSSAQGRHPNARWSSSVAVSSDAGYRAALMPGLPGTR